LWKKKGSKKSQPKSQPDGFVVALASPCRDPKPSGSNLFGGCPRSFHECQDPCAGALSLVLSLDEQRKNKLSLQGERRHPGKGRGGVKEMNNIR